MNILWLTHGQLIAGNLVLLMAWRNCNNADAYVKTAKLPDYARLRQIRVIRDYGMYDRREATQYYPTLSCQA